VRIPKRYFNEYGLGIIFAAVAIAFLFIVLGLLPKRAWPATTISLAYVDGAGYYKAADYSDWWDKSVEYAGQDLTIWNEIWIIPGKISIDTNYKVNLTDGRSRAILSGNWTKAVNKFYTIELAGGAYAEGDRVFPCLVASNRFGWNFFVFKFSDHNYLYFPVGKQAALEMKNDLTAKISAVFLYFKVLHRTEFRDNAFKNYTVAGVEFDL